MPPLPRMPLQSLRFATDALLHGYPAPVHPSLLRKGLAVQFGPDAPQWQADAAAWLLEGFVFQLHRWLVLLALIGLPLSLRCCCSDACKARVPLEIAVLGAFVVGILFGISLSLERVRM